MTIFGWDMSHYDAPDIGNAIEQGISFITHKIGGDRNDPEAGQWWSDVKGERSRALLGGYWVLYPGRSAARADEFIDQLDLTCPGWRSGPFILQIDCEKWNGKESTVPSISEINAHCDRLRVLAPKLMPIAYVPEWVYGSSVKGLRYPIWASSYVNGTGSFKSLYPGDNSSRWGAYGGKTPAILQYTSSATIGGQTTCDANAYRGTLAQLTQLLAPGWAKETIDVATLDAQDLASIKSVVKDLMENDGAIARGLRLQPNNLSDTERVLSAREVVKQLTPVIGQMQVDADTLADALAGPLAAALTPKLPDDISQDEVTTAVKQAFREAFGSGE
jgi:hypothetical protein